MDRICAFFFAAFGLLAVCTGDIKIHHDIQSWSDARKACRNQVGFSSCDLIDKTRLNEVWSTLDLSGDESYWVGAQIFFRWFWAAENGSGLRLFQDHGCYRLPKVDVSSLSSLQYNGPHQCYRACDDRAFVYLLGDKCYCSHTLEGEVASTDLCTLPCEGSEDKCGGKDGHFSLYSLPKELEFADRYMSRTCAAAQLRDNKLRIESTSCSNSRHYFCLSEKQASEIPTRSRTYQTAVSRCRSEHQSSLPTLQSYEEAGQLLSDLKAMEDKMVSFTTFWLPLRRNVRVVWVDGEEGDEGGEFGQCLAARPSSSSYDLTKLTCSQSHAAICDCSAAVVNPDDHSKNGGSHKDKQPGPSKTIVAVVVVFILLTVVVLVLLFIFLRRRYVAKRDEEILANDKWGNRENPTYKGTPEGENPADATTN